MLKRLKWFASLFCGAVASCVLFAAPGAFAGEFDVGLRGNVGFGTGSTDDSSVDGKIGFSTGGGLAVQYYFTESDAWNFGLASGVEYLFLNYNSTDNAFTLPGPITVERASETSYNYLTIPLTFKVGRVLNEKLSITGDIGGFVGIFLSGESDNTYTPDPYGLNGAEKLDDTNTESINAGLRFAVGLPIVLSEKLKLVPGLLYDLGLTDVTLDSVAPPRDTLSSWTFTVDLLYTLF